MKRRILVSGRKQTLTLLYYRRLAGAALLALRHAQVRLSPLAPLIQQHGFCWPRSRAKPGRKRNGRTSVVWKVFCCRTHLAVEFHTVLLGIIRPCASVRLLTNPFHPLVTGAPGVSRKFPRRVVLVSLPPPLPLHTTQFDGRAEEVRRALWVYPAATVGVVRRCLVGDRHSEPHTPQAVFRVSPGVGGGRAFWTGGFEGATETCGCGTAFPDRGRGESW